MSTRAIIWSYGGGTQSIAIAVLIAQGKLPKPERVVIADTSREKSFTWRYTEQHVKPILASAGLELEIAPHTLATVDLYSQKQRDLLIPAFTATGQMSTFCSNEWKQRVIRRYLRAQGYGPDKPVTLWLGMSLDELGRMKPSGAEWVQHAWPLIMDLHITREECRQIVINAGLPDPPKSACWMCPFTRNSEWQRMKRDDPQDWQAAVEFDKQIREADSQHDVYVHRSATLLGEADLSTPDKPPLPMFGEIEDCDSGYCMV